MSDLKFSCPTCGQHIVSDATNVGMSITCPACQTLLTVPAASPETPLAPPAFDQSTVSHPAASGLSDWAIASFICSLFLCVGCIPGIICGHLARRKIKNHPQAGGGLAMTGLVISYLSLAGCVLIGLLVMLGLSSPKFMKGFHKGYEESKQRREARQSASEKSTANDSDSAISPLWNLNLTTAQFPDQPAAGKIRGQDFTVASAIAQNGNITLREGQSSAGDRQVVIFTYLKPGESLAGKTFDTSPANPDSSTNAAPQIQVRWRDDDNAGKRKSYAKGYAMKLELGAADADGKIPGKIYLCLPDDQKSCVAGTFSLEEKKTPVKKKSKKKTN